MKIKKKTWPDMFEKLLSGEKKFDLRLADFSCGIGDVLIFCEWDPNKKEYTGRILEKEVTYILKTKDLKFWSEEEIEKNGFQVMSLK